MCEVGKRSKRKGRFRNGDASVLKPIKFCIVLSL